MSGRRRIAAELAITAGRVPTPATVTIEGGVIESVVWGTVDADADEQVPILAPGFIDLQVNGINDTDVASAGRDAVAWDRLDDLLRSQGTTSWCPTLITAPLDELERQLSAIEWARTRPSSGLARPAIVGAHVEGPFLGSRAGAHPPSHIRPPDLGWLASLSPPPGGPAVVTIGVEHPDAPDAIQLLRRDGRVASIGHTGASFEQAEAAIDAGATLVTHLYNAMSGLHHRDPGVVGAGLTDDRVSVAIIADHHHVHPAALAVAARLTGPAERLVAVTDAVGWRSAALRDVVGYDGSVPRLPDGTIAGSALTMDHALANLHAAGISLVDAIAAATSTPARLLGLGDRGHLVAGMRADLVALTPDLRVVWARAAP